MSVNNILMQLASDNGRKFKEELLLSHKDNDMLKRTVQLALDPTVNFYIRKIPSYTPVTPVWSLGEAFVQLNALSNRVVTGNAAIEHLANILSHLDENDAEVVKKIIAKDLRCGVQESTANKVWKGLIPEFPYMRCALPKHAKMDKFSWKDGVFSQLKADGMFANVSRYNDGSVSLLSRSGSEFPIEQFGQLAKQVSCTFDPNTQMHGEMLVKRDGKILPREIGNGILNSVLKGGSFKDNEVPMLLVWDQIPLNFAVPGGMCKTPYFERYNGLKQQIDGEKPTLIEMIETRIVHSMEDAHEHYAEMLAKGYEGTIIKNRTAVWKDTTSKEQVKYKLDIDVDLEIVGFTEGNGKNAELFGSITCKSAEGNLVVNVSGFKDKKQSGVMTRAEIWEQRNELIGTIITVKSNNMMPPTKSNDKWSLFLPRAVEFRSDKKQADSLAKIKEQFENAVA